MFNVKKNKYIYKIYNKIKKDKKIFIISFSSGVDSNFGKLNFKKINKNIININVNHNLNKIDKKIKKVFTKNLIISKIKNINSIKIEKFLKKKRFKKIKNICNKKKLNIWIFQQEDEILENFFIQIIIKKFFLKFKKEIKKKKIFKKIKPLLKISKKYIKKLLIKNKKKWIEEKDNIKFKNIRNKFRINIMNVIKTNIKKLKKKIIKVIN